MEQMLFNTFNNNSKCLMTATGSQWYCLLPFHFKGHGQNEECNSRIK